MGKIKVRALGDETLENKQKEKSKIKAKEKSASRRMVKGAKGGERTRLQMPGASATGGQVVSVGPSEEELAKIVIASEAKQSQTGKLKTDKPKSEKRKTHGRSKSYQLIAKIIDRSKKYSLTEALDVLEKLKRSPPAGGFDETVELHINTIETGLSGNITLPHGTGKRIRVAIATDELIAKIEKGLPATPSQAPGLRGGRGKIDFDILLAAPAMMPKLARVAKILGPKGLMPNPKNATLVKDPEKAAENFKKGQINFRTEAKAPIMHLTVGKISFGAKKLSENIQTLIEAIKKDKIRNITLKSTMSPGIKLEM